MPREVAGREPLGGRIRRAAARGSTTRLLASPLVAALPAGGPVLNVSAAQPVWVTPTWTDPQRAASVADRQAGLAERGANCTDRLKSPDQIADNICMAGEGVPLAAPDRLAGHVQGIDPMVRQVVQAARQHLDLDVAFLSQFVDGERVFRVVDSDLSVIEEGGGDPLEESYCHYVADGSLPEFLADPSRHPVSARLSATAALGVGTHLSVPVRLSDGRLFGTLCCFGFSVRPELGPRDVQTLRILADLVAGHVERLAAAERDHRERHQRTTALLDDPTGLTVLFQPVVDLATGETTAVEALSRFPALPGGPEQVFADAWAVGLGVDLELAAVRTALHALERLPAKMRLGVNVSPATLTTADFADAVAAVPSGRLAVEITEHAAVEDYSALRVARDDLRSRGIRLAIDDVGMGFSGLHHILESGPDTIKIDAAVVRDVDSSPAKAAMIEALVSFAHRMDVLVIAEGIETEAELATLRAMGVAWGQGYHLGRPSDLTPILGSLDHS